MPIPITMPALSPTMTEGNLAKWHKKEGDAVEAGEVIAEIETDKATMEVEAVDEGTIGKIVVAEGTENVPVNEVIAVLLEEGEEWDDQMIGSSDNQKKAEPKKDSDNKPKKEETAESKDSDHPIIRSSDHPKDRIFASPLARRIAADKGIDLSGVKGSGPNGRIVKADLEDVKPGQAKPPEQKTPAQAAPQIQAGPSSYDEIPNNNVRKIVARRLLESKQNVPHFYLTIECRIDALLEARKKLNEAADGAYKISVNDFVIKAVAQALKAYPAANVSWTEEAIRQYHHADVSVAVATPNGLITPIVFAAESKGLKQISEEVKDLAKRARDNKLKPEEFQGGTFSVSNLGMYGVQEFGAIINPPQSCILAVGAGEQKPFVDGKDIKIGTFMKCTLSVDHRSVDGAVGAEYLQYFKRYIENPVEMLV